MSDVNLSDYQTHDKDTGSANYQVALLTSRIQDLTEHLKTNKKDVSSRRGLLRMVSRRRKMLDYLRAGSEEGYQKIIKDLGLRR